MQGRIYIHTYTYITIIYDIKSALGSVKIRYCKLKFHSTAAVVITVYALIFAGWNFADWSWFLAIFICFFLSQTVLFCHCTNLKPNLNFHRWKNACSDGLKICEKLWKLSHLKIKVHKYIIMIYNNMPHPQFGRMTIARKKVWNKASAISKQCNMADQMWSGPIVWLTQDSLAVSHCHSIAVSKS